MQTVFIIIFFLLIVFFFIYKKNQNNKMPNETKDETKNEVEVKEEITLQSLIDALPEKQRAMYELAINPTASLKPVLYALVTCQHCIRLQRFLKQNEIDFQVVHVDLFAGEVRKSIMLTLKKFNERGSFPTFVLPSGNTVVGFREHILKEALNNEPKRTD